MRGLKPVEIAEMNQRRVASFTDAWIETNGDCVSFPVPLSHLLQMRGLKLVRSNSLIAVRRVASFTDAWIETGLMRIELLGGTKSHLLQMRGLKLPIILKSINLLLSHLLQMRGLKPSLSAMFERGQIRSHLLQMRGLKLVMLIHLLISVLVASFTDAWIETLKYSRDFIQLRRIFYRCVD